ncbi:MAG: hypothetical protein RRC07_07545 [Anaerolineae bacterium]|nr:hypothetical protein [Anaerolineae bacterium]
MEHKHALRRLAMLALFLGTLVVAAGLGRAADAGDYAYMNEYPLRAEEGWLGGAPEDIVAAGPGHVWFTLPESDQVGELTVSPDSYDFNYYQLDPGSSPAGIAYANEAAWVTARGTNKLLRIKPGDPVDEWPLPPGSSQPAGIAASPTGNLWIAATGSNQVLRFEPSSGTFEAYDYTTDNAGITDIAVYNDEETVYFTAENLDMVVLLTPWRYPTSAFTPLLLIDGYTGTIIGRPGQLAVSSAGRLWVVAVERDWLGYFAPGTTQIWRWVEVVPTGTELFGLALSAMGSKDFVWFTLPEAGSVGVQERNAQGALLTRYYHIPTAGSVPRSIAVDSTNHAWIAVAGSNLIAEWIPPYSQLISLPLISNNS